MEISSLTALLKVNGLSAQSPSDDIRKALLASGYRDAEIPDALALLQAGEAMPSTPSHVARAAYVTPILERTRVSATTAPLISPFGGRVDTRQFWPATILLTFLYAVIFFVVEVTFIPLYSLAGGLSLRAIPNLATAPITTLVLLGVGALLVVVPLVFFAILAVGLQVRRYHDIGLTGTVWASIFFAEVALCLALLSSPTALIVALIGSALISIVLLSLPSAKEENAHGPSTCYTSTCAALLGSTYEEGNIGILGKRFVLPIIYIEVLGIVFAYGIHAILPRISFPTFAPPPVESATGLKVTSEQ